MYGYIEGPVMGALVGKMGNRDTIPFDPQRALRQHTPISLLQTAAPLSLIKVVNIPWYKSPSDAICPVTAFEKLKEHGIMAKSHSP